MTISFRSGTTDLGLLLNGSEKQTIDSSGNVTFTGKVIQAAQSMVKVNTNNGFGSTNTAIRRFTNITNGVNGCVIQGTDITFADSATLGSTFTVNTNGVYAITYSDGFSVAANFGLSVNSTQLTTDITSIAVTDRIAFGITSAVNYHQTCGDTLYLAAGSVIRPHTTPSLTASASAPCAIFTIVRVA